MEVAPLSPLNARGNGGSESVSLLWSRDLSPGPSAPSPGAAVMAERRRQLSHSWLLLTPGLHIWRRDSVYGTLSPSGPSGDQDEVAVSARPSGGTCVPDQAYEAGKGVGGCGCVSGRVRFCARAGGCESPFPSPTPRGAPPLPTDTWRPQGAESSRFAFLPRPGVKPSCDPTIRLAVGGDQWWRERGQRAGFGQDPGLLTLLLGGW